MLIKRKMEKSQCFLSPKIRVIIADLYILQSPIFEKMIQLLSDQLYGSNLTQAEAAVKIHRPSVPTFYTEILYYSLILI